MIWQDSPQLSIVPVLLMIAVFYWAMVAGYWVLQAYKDNKSGKVILVISGNKHCFALVSWTIVNESLRGCYPTISLSRFFTSAVVAFVVEDSVWD